MGTRPSLERIRDWADGALSPDDTAELERELRSDPALADFAEQYRFVHALSGSPGVVPNVPPCTTGFEAIERRVLDEGRARRIAPVAPAARVAAIAAGILLLAGALVATRRLAELAEPTTVELRTIPLAAGSERDTRAPSIPASLADFHPVQEGRIRWVRALDEAREIASATHRPLFLFVRYEGCPIAEALRSNALLDDRVIGLAEECVPCELDIQLFPAGEQKAMLASGYPFLELQADDGASLATFSGVYAGPDGGDELAGRLDDGLAGFAPDAEPLPWSLSRDLAELHGRARSAEDARTFGAARRFYEELVANGATGEFAEAGRRGMLRIALLARDVLIAARALAQEETARAAEHLQQGLEEFRGTPHAAELEEVLERLRATGRFPPLDWAS